MKINIEGYEDMTPEQKVAALEASYVEGEKVKTALDKATSEAASYKKQLRERMSEDEAAKAKASEEHAALIARLEQLEHEKAVSGYVASYLAMGYEANLAKSTAEALAKGDMDTVFKNQKVHADAREKALRTELLKQTPPPVGGSGETKLTKETLGKMNLAELTKFAEEHPDAFNEFYGGK